MMSSTNTRPRFAYQIRDTESEIVFYLSGVMDMQGGEEIRDEIKTLDREGKSIIFNLSETRILSSGGLTLLVEIAKMLKTDGVPFQLESPSDMVMRTLRIVHVDRLIEIRTT